MQDKTTDPRVPSPRLWYYPYLIAACFPLGMWLHNVAEEPTVFDLAVVFGLTLGYVLAADVACRMLIGDTTARFIVHTLAVVGCLAYGHVAQLLAPLGAMDRPPGDPRGVGADLSRARRDSGVGESR